jgi:A/G-specific adenine glycosylase
VRRRALELVPESAPDAWNHALMDLGATICTARVAQCEECPVAEWCASAGLVDPSAERAMRVATGSAPPRERFEDTQRFVRGRIVAALVEAGTNGAGEAELHASLPDGISAERYAAALAGLLTGGLVESTAGRLHLPR